MSGFLADQNRWRIQLAIVFFLQIFGAQKCGGKFGYRIWLVALS